MATIKSYTDLSQSKTLSKILPIESADMYYDGFGRLPQGYAYTLISPNSFEYDKPCWSLAALLGVLPKNLNIGRPSLESNYKEYYWIQYYDEFMKPNNYRTECFNNPVDTCVDMIIRLNELNLL